jgi:uncharacterized Zn-binding protein involved in type VI secretion
MQAARMGDLTSCVCWNHSPDPCRSVIGIIVTGSPNVTSNNLGQARQSDIVLGTCGHIGIIVTGSPTATANNLGYARVGDCVAGQITGMIVLGSPNILIG